MEKSDKVEFLSLAIQRVIQDNTIKESSINASDDDSAHIHEHHNHLPSRLLSEKEEWRREGHIERSEVPNSLDDVGPANSQAETKNDHNVSQARDQDQKVCSSVKPEYDEITKELKKIKRQNFVTHCLLSAMIVLTVTWQISEVSLIFSLKERLSHPFKQLGRKLMGMLQGPHPNGNGADKNSSHGKQERSLLPYPSVQTPGVMKE